MMGLGLVGWGVLLGPWGFLAPTQSFEWMGFFSFLVVVLVTRSLAFRPFPGTVVSIDSGFYVAATLCLGPLPAGRLVAVALSLDALLRLLNERRGSLTLPWQEAVAYVVYFGGMSGALLALVARVLGQGVFAPSTDVGVVAEVLIVGVAFIAVHYAIQLGRLQLKSRSPLSLVTRMGLWGVLAEVSLLPLASIAVFLYHPREPLKFILLAATLILINFGFRRLSRIGAKLRRRVEELEVLNATARRLAGALHLHELVEALALETTAAIEPAQTLVFARVADGVFYYDTYDRVEGKFSRARGELSDEPCATVLAEGEPVNLSKLHGGSWLGVPVRVYGEVAAVLAVKSPKAGAFGADETRLLESIGSQTAVALQNAKHYEMAMVDALTRLYVRRYFDARLEEEIQRSQPVIMMDIDNFKQLNDTRGHPVGDVALRAVAKVVRGEMRGVDTAARYGGEEFAMILPRTSMVDAYSQAERIRSSIEELNIEAGDGEPVEVTASFGIAAYPESGATSGEALVHMADKALYRAKRTGKNRVELYWVDEDSRPVVPNAGD
jgi:diguanylate cyclase (GGDEF)-like protein